MDIAKILTGIRVNKKDMAPMYLQIANCLIRKIRDHTIPAGTKLPPERELARLLGVSRTTTINAYGLLEEQGLVQTRMGSGTFVTELFAPVAEGSSLPWEQLFTPYRVSAVSSIVRSLLAGPADDQVLSFAVGMPDPALYPMDKLREVLGASMAEVPSCDFGYISTDGYAPLRQTIAQWQVQSGIHTTADHILIVSGSQQGLYLCAKALVEPRDYVIVETPTYLGAVQILESLGARVLQLPVSEFLDLELLEDYLIRYRPKMFYTIPTFQNPTGRVMPLAERKALIALAARYRLVIVEDDPYSQLYYGKQPPPSLKSLDSFGGVIYIGTFSKMLLPGLRVGWLNADPQVVSRISQEKHFMDLHCSNLSQMAAQRFMTLHLAQHLTVLREEYRRRRDAMHSALNKYCSGHLSFRVPEGGFYFWCTLQSSSSPSELLRVAAAAGVTFLPGEPFLPGGVESRQIRLCFATHDSERITQGIRILGQILGSGGTTLSKQEPPSALALV